MYIAIYGRDLKHIANVIEAKYETTERVFDLDTSSFSGIANADISRGLIFVLCENNGKEVYSGYIKNLKQPSNLVTFSGDDFKKTFDTEVILDYASHLQSSPATLGAIFRDVSNAILEQNTEATSIVPHEIIYPNPQDDIFWIANYDMQYLTVNANKFLKTYLAYFGYFIDSRFDVINKKIKLEIKKNTDTVSIRLDDFTHETTKSETLINKAIATLKFNNTKEGLMWIASSKAYWDRQLETNRGTEGPQSFPEPLTDANDYEYGYALQVNYYESGTTDIIEEYYQVSNAAINRPRNLPTRTYYLGNDNLIYETLIPKDKMILPVITKVFEEEFFQTAQFNAVSELVNSRYNENIIITNTQTPVDISRYDLYTMVKVYDKNGLMVEMPLAEIERSNEGYKIKLGFKKTKFTEIIKSLTEDAPIKSTGASGSGGGGGLSEGNVQSIIDTEVPGMIEEAKQTGTFPPSTHTHNIADIPDIPNTKLSGLFDTNSKILENLIPAVAITDTFEASSQAAMLALTVQKGDICVRTDLNKSFILAQTPGSMLTNWKELRTPTDAVLSVAGKTGAVSLNKNDVGLSNVNNTSDENKPVSLAVQNALDNKKIKVITQTAYNNLGASRDLLNTIYFIY